MRVPFEMDDDRVNSNFQSLERGLATHTHPAAEGGGIEPFPMYIGSAGFIPFGGRAQMNSGVMTILFRGRIEDATNPVFYTRMLIQCSTPTTMMEMALVAFDGPTIIATVGNFTFPAGVPLYSEVSFEWLRPANLSNGLLDIAIAGRRSSGAGDVYIGPIYISQLVTTARHPLADLGGHQEYFPGP
jgi:hypothetical protein